MFGKARENEMRRSFDFAAFGGCAQDDSVLERFAQFQLLVDIVN